MIVAFHFSTILLCKWFSIFKKWLSLPETVKFDVFQHDVEQPLAQRDADNDLKFDPPVYQQRYGTICRLLQNEKWQNTIHRIVDFGCADFGLFRYIKNIPGLSEINFVDIDEDAVDCTFKIVPLNIDYLRRRSEELVLNVFVGSAADPDPRLRHIDAVIAIELIEHLYPDVLEGLPYHFFAVIQPKLVLITTPNSDFNVLFPHLEGFRHIDHKFEWTRAQFQDWATNITLRFPNYTVSYCGIGCGPDATTKLGCCSQLAIFIRKDVISGDFKLENKCKCKKILETCSCNDLESYGICTYYSHSKKIVPDSSSSQKYYYKLVNRIEYPFEIDKRSEEEKIIDELRYRINNFGNCFNGNFYVEDRNRGEIPLSKLNYGKNGSDQLISVPELGKLLEKYKYKIEECQTEANGQTELCVIYEEEMTSSDSASGSGYNSDSNNTNQAEECLDWGDSEATENKDANICETEEKTEQVRVDNEKMQEGLYDSGYQKSPMDESPQSPVKNLKILENTPKPLKTSEEKFSKNCKKPNETETKKNNSGCSSESEKTKSPKKEADPENGATDPENRTGKPNEEKSNKDGNEEDQDENFRRNEQDRFFRNNQDRSKKMAQVLNYLDQDQLNNLEGWCGGRNVELFDLSPVAGPSSKLIRRNAGSKAMKRSPSEEEAKSLASCILENSLNKIEDEENKCELIQDIEPVPIIEAQILVENGDLVNNNRDREGNNYQAEVEPVLNDVIDNLEANGDFWDVQDENDRILVDYYNHYDNDESEHNEEEADMELERSSRQALCDSNSHIDLIDDVDMQHVDVIDMFGPPLRPPIIVNVENLILDQQNDFPIWLLGMLAIAEEPENREDSEEDEDDRSNGNFDFYSQGDGVGIHPSVVTVAMNEDATDDDEEDEDDDENEDDNDETNEDETSEESNTSGEYHLDDSVRQNSLMDVNEIPEVENAEEFLLVGQHLENPNDNVSDDDDKSPDS